MLLGCNGRPEVRKRSLTDYTVFLSVVRPVCGSWVESVFTDQRIEDHVLDEWLLTTVPSPSYLNVSRTSRSKLLRVMSSCNGRRLAFPTLDPLSVSTRGSLFAIESLLQCALYLHGAMRKNTVLRIERWGTKGRRFGPFVSSIPPSDVHCILLLAVLISKIEQLLWDHFDSGWFPASSWEIVVFPRFIYLT